MMRRCLDCGAERTTDQCPACGLTSAAAEFVFRRRLITQTAIFLAGSLVFPYISQIYPPLDLDAMLVFFGVVFFAALGLALFLENRARARKEIEALKHLFTGLIPIPFILSVGIFLNGRLDSPKNIAYHPTTVVGRYQMKGVIRGTRRLFVYSWREGRRYERLAVDYDDYDRFHEGDKINVGEEPGALGIPWFYGVYRADQPHGETESGPKNPAPPQPNSTAGTQPTMRRAD
jgi:hypothetical protein